MKRIIKLLPLLVIISLFFATSGFAKSENAQKSLVSLGDSIPFGYGLFKNTSAPSKEAFPYLMGEAADLRVRNLAVPGWKTSDLVNALKNDQKFRQAVNKADYITLNIGSNDLLKPLSDAMNSGVDLSDPQALMNLLGPSIKSLQNNIPIIIQEIYSLNPDVKVVVYNLYNPFPNLSAGTQLLQGIINPNLELLQLHFPNLVIAHAYVIGLDPVTNLIPGDVHPSITGQKLLAEIGLKSLGLN
ncbi:SGNH/GDSL hydrolase family protein [Neobacillus mesonae]|uniref:SGNH/GDSL hydrolase family protein n=1 Tax=Neobacillus mesonae TaxID=1193713 RepID=UPI0020422920|nr:SGNH/GDSL hydrolase family protein [Neobacillus mesonae]MCM3567068.1 SGNH/GDSL hydrolase family protein [Neobacillus mesonae]